MLKNCLEIHRKFLCLSFVDCFPTIKLKWYSSLVRLNPELTGLLNGIVSVIFKELLQHLRKVIMIYNQFGFYGKT
jgi:hypothetical protein